MAGVGRQDGPGGLRSPLVVALVVLGLLAAGCAGRGPDGDPVGPAAAGPLVTLVRYGGPANVREQVEVSATGDVTLLADGMTGPATRRLAVEDLAALRAALQRSQFATLEREYLDRTAADAFQYDVTYQGRTVTTDDGVVPERLRPAIDLLVGLLAPAARP